MTTAAHPTQPAERPTLSIVKDNTDQPVEGTVVEHQGGAVTTRPTWLTAVYEHALDNRLYAPQIGRGYAHLTRNWFHAHRDYWPQQIATAEADLAAAADSATQNKARAQLEQHRANYCHHRRIHSLKAGGWGVATLASAGVGTVFGGALFDIGLGLAALGLGAWKGRAGATARRAPLSPNLAPSGETTSGIAPTAGDEKVLEVLKRLGFEAEIIEPLTRQADGTSTMTVDLDDTVTALKSKTEALAGALKRDITMVDVSKGAHASQAKIWLADTDPFATTRRTPSSTR